MSKDDDLFIIYAHFLELRADKYKSRENRVKILVCSCFKETFNFRSYGRCLTQSCCQTYIIYPLFDHTPTFGT